jgi:hypothetical protein
LFTSQLRGFDSTDFQAFTSTQLDGLGSSQIASLSTSQVIGIESDDFVAFNSVELRSFTTAHFAAFSTDQLVGLDSAQFGSLLTSQLRALGTYGIEALNSEDFSALNTTQIASFASLQIRAIDTEDLAGFGSQQIAALTSTQIDGFTTDQIYSLTSTQVVGFETQDLATFDMAQQLAFNSDAIAAMSTAQINALLLASPIVLDLDGDGVRTTSADQGVQFDVLGDGQVAKFGWVSSTDGFLVVDRNSDGIINDGRELFGSGTRLADGRRAADGFAALAEFDSDKDGDVDANDANFNQLKVWVDGDQDGITDAGELKTLAELQIASLQVAATKSNEVDNGNALALQSNFTKTDGSKHEMIDVWFAKDQPKPTAADLLAPAQAAIPLPSAAPGADEAKATTHGSTSPNSGTGEQLAVNTHRRLLPEDDDSFKPPLI